MKSFKLSVIIALACCFSIAFAQEGGSPEEAAAMKAIMAAGTPGPEHEMLAKMAGSWNCTVKMWMDPTQPPMESKATDVCKMVMGGRVAVCDFTGDWMGQPFHGQSQMGYANFAKMYWSTWTDDGSTSLMYSEGTASPDGKTITLYGTYDDPMSNTMNKPWKQVITVIDDDHHSFAAYEKVGTPDEYKMMEMTYTRAK